MTEQKRLRIFISSPSDVRPERLTAERLVARLAREFSYHFRVEPVLWEREPLIATEHFQSSITPPHATDIVVVILWSRLGVPLPLEKYVGPISGRPVTGTEWEFEDAVAGYRASRLPDLLFYRKRAAVMASLDDDAALEQQRQQKRLVEDFVQRWFIDTEAGTFSAAFREFTTAAEFEELLEGHLRELLVKRLNLTEGGALQEGIRWHRGSPFRGLQSFELEHAPVFYGRTRVRNELRELLGRQAASGCAFVLVCGASGSGKSSLVKAGLLSDLKLPGMIERVALCRHAVLRPADAPDDLIDGLASALLGPTSLPELAELNYDRASLAGLLREAPHQVTLPMRQGLAQAAVTARLTERAEARLVLVVDQLEELFTLEGLTPADLTTFVAALDGLARSGLVWVVATMRSDFFERLESLPALARLSGGEARYLLLLPESAELGRIVRQPAREAGVRFEFDGARGLGLDDVLQQAAAHAPSALPLLEFTLDQLWERRTERGEMTFAAYEEMGGLEGALGQRAEEEFARLPTEVQAALPEVLRTLATVGQGAQGILAARAVPLAAFPPGAPQHRLVAAFLAPQARLLVVDGDDKGARVRVAHEALLTHWERAREQLERDRTDLQTRARLEQAALLWQTAPTSDRESLLLRPGLPLAEAEDLLRRRRNELDRAVISYVESSVAAAEAGARRERRRLQVAVAVFTVLTFIASLGAWLSIREKKEAVGQRHFAEQQRFRAEQERDETLKNQSRYLAGEAHALMRESNYELAELLSLEGLPLDPARPDRPMVQETVSALYQAISEDSLRAALRHDGPVEFAVFSPGGQQVVTTSGDKSARVWDPATGALIRTLRHEGRVSSAAFSPKADRVVTTSDDQTAQVWETGTGALISTFRHDGRVNAAAFDPKGNRVVTASDDKTVRIWDIATGAEIQRLQHDRAVNAAAFSPNGDRVASASDDKTAQIWDAPTGAPIKTLHHQDVVNFIAFSPKGDHLVTASRDQTAQIWDAASGVPIATLPHEAGVTSAVFNPTGDRVVTASKDNTAGIWDAATGTEIKRLAHNGTVNSATFSPTGEQVLTASKDHTARIWDASTGAEIKRFQHDEGVVNSAVYSPKGDRVVTASGDDTARIWDATVATPIAAFQHDGPVKSTSFSPNGDRLITASDGATVEIWKVTTGAKLWEIKVEDEVNSTAFSPTGDRVVAASSDHTARILDAATGAEIRRLRHDRPVASAAFSPSGDRVVTASKDHTARLWNAATGAPLLTLEHQDEVRSAAFSPSGDRVVTGSKDGVARIWDAATGAEIKSLHHDRTVDAVAFSRTGDRVVTACFNDNIARIWDITTGALIFELEHEDEIRSAAFSPTGDRLVTGSKDHTARIWDAGSGAEIKKFQHDGTVNSAGFSPKGDRVVTGSDDHTARTWDAGTNVEIKDIIDYSRAAMLRALTAAKRTEFFLSGSDVGNETTSTVVPVHSDLAPCDALTGNPSDPKKVGTRASSESVNTDDALTACTAAVAAAPDEPRFRYQLGRILALRHEYAQALQELQTAADHGYAMAMNDLGLLYRDGKGVLRDAAAASRLFRQASDAGATEAVRNLAELLMSGAGKGATGDPAEALRLFSQAADRGDPWSHKQLAELYERGEWIEQDLRKALYHHTVAANLFTRLGVDNEAAFETARRGSLARNMAQPEVVRTWHEAGAWLSRVENTGGKSKE